MSATGARDLLLGVVTLCSAFLCLANASDGHPYLAVIWGFNSGVQFATLLVNRFWL